MKEGEIRIRQIGFVCVLGIIAIINAIPASVSAEVKKLTMGIVPQQSATRWAMNWVPFMTEVGIRSGIKINFATAKDIPTFEECLATGAYDMAYMNPYHYTEFSIDPGYVAFAHQRGKRLKGILVTKKDSSIKELSDLEARDIAFPSPAAFGASVLPRAEIGRLGISFQPHYVRSYDSVYRAVAAGIYPAGGGVLRPFGRIPEELRAQLRVFYETEAYTPHAFAAHPRVKPSIVKKIAEAMAAMDEQSDYLRALGMKGVSEAKDEDWNDVRSLRLTRYQTEILKADGKCHSG